MSAPEAPYGQSPYSRPATAARAPAAEPAGAPPSSRVAEATLVSLWVGRALVWLVYAFATIAAILLLIAFFLQLTGANPAAPFAAAVGWCDRWIHGLRARSFVGDRQRADARDRRPLTTDS
jgi:hypothetical protein